MSTSLPISQKYREAVFTGVVLQALVGAFSLPMMDGGAFAQNWGIALVAFWGGAAVLIWRHPQSPTRADIAFVRYGYLPVVVLSWFLAHFIWSVRGVE